MNEKNPRWFWNGVATLETVLRRRSTRAWIAQSGLALVGVAVATMLIGAIQSLAHISNISLLYLPVVLWLAAGYGRWPAILASVLSFLSYDYFFIMPVHQFTVNEPTEWLSLFALLATALTLGHMAAEVRSRARDVEESQRQTQTLYRLAQMIAASETTPELYEALTSQVVTVFAASGVHGCALLLPDETGALEIAAVAGAQRLSGAENASAESGAGRKAILRRPLKTPRGVVGTLMVSGTSAIHGLAPDEAVGLERVETNPRQATLFSAFSDQMALAIERASLAREVAHVAALRESDRLKDALLGSVTHDLRTPLASIKAAVGSLLRGNIWAEPERRELLESIDTSVNRLNRLVANLLDLSRLEAGIAQLHLDWMLMSDVIATVLDRLDLTGQTRGYDILVEEPENLPLVLMDHEQIEQTLTNLIENATKYSPQGSIIRIRVWASETELIVAVSDQGIGIPQRELEAVFNKFYRVKQARLPWSPSRPPTGTGLGLAICASIIRAHGGRIWAESALGKGSTLTFTLPLSHERPEGALPDLPEAPETDAASESQEVAQ